MLYMILFEPPARPAPRRGPARPEIGGDGLRDGRRTPRKSAIVAPTTKAQNAAIARIMTITSSIRLRHPTTASLASPCWVSPDDRLALTLRPACVSIAMVSMKVC